MTRTLPRTGSVVFDSEDADVLSMDDSPQSTQIVPVDDPGVQSFADAFDAAHLSGPLVYGASLHGGPINILQSHPNAALQRWKRAYAALALDQPVRVLTISIPTAPSAFSHRHTEVRLLIAHALTSIIDADPVSIEPEDQEAVAAVERLQTRLGLPQKDILKAAGIRRSTFHSWKKNPDAQPRVHSLGRLWSLVDLVDDLTSLLDRPVQQWLHAQPHRLRMLRDGQFEALFDGAAAGDTPQKHRGAAPDWVRNFDSEFDDTRAQPQENLGAQEMLETPVDIESIESYDKATTD